LRTSLAVSRAAALGALPPRAAWRLLPVSPARRLFGAFAFTALPTRRKLSSATMPRPEIRVQFAHGLESSPQGNKARLFAAHFTAETPAMNTRDFESCVAVHAQTLKTFAPNVLVGSSFGGAVVVELLSRGLYAGPTLLLAQAALHYRPDARLPEHVPVTLVHARQDDVVAFEHSERLARTGSPELVELLARDDDHPLTRLCDSGELITLVERCFDRHAHAHAQARPGAR
jgi:predicted esterase